MVQFKIILLKAQPLHSLNSIWALNSQEALCVVVVVVVLHMPRSARWLTPTGGAHAR